MIWRNPAAWLGLLTLLVPIAIHLLVRQQAVSYLFPSLRFIPPSRLASVRRRLISDWPLLLVRLAIVALAVAALADPLWQSPARRAAWDSRHARAIVIDTSASAGTPEEHRRLAEREASGAFRSATFETAERDERVERNETGEKDAADARGKAGGSGEAGPRGRVDERSKADERSEANEGGGLSTAIARAADWLRTTPPARREIVVVSDFQLGALDPHTLARLPDSIGVRFVRVGRTPATRSADGQPRTRRGDDAEAPDARGTTRAARERNSRGNRDHSNLPDGPDGLDLDPLDRLDVWTPHVTVNAHETAVTWTRRATGVRSVAASPSSPTSIEGSTAARQDVRIEVAWEGVGSGVGGEMGRAMGGVTLHPFRVQLRANGVDRPTVLAAARAVLAQGVAIADDATTGAGANAAGGEIIISITGADDASLPADVTRLAAPWMSEVLRRVATDDALVRATGRARIGSAASLEDRGGSARAPDHRLGNARTRDPRVVTDRDEGHRAADVPAPWIAVARDADGRPVLLAAAAHPATPATPAPTGQNGGSARNGAAPNGQTNERETTTSRLLIVSRLAAAGEGTALLVRATLNALAGRDPLLEAEVLTLPDATLAQWQRPAGPPAPDEWQQVESTDRRWLWAAVLALLGVEYVMRRRNRRTASEPDRSYEHAA